MKIILTESQFKKLILKEDTEELITIEGIFYNSIVVDTEKELPHNGIKIKFSPHAKYIGFVEGIEKKYNGKKVNVVGFTDNNQQPTKDNPLIVNPFNGIQIISTVPEGPWKMNSDDGDRSVRRMVSSQLIRKMEDLTMGRINSYDELFFNMKRLVMKVVDMIKRDFSKNKELTFNKKSLINYIQRTMENHPQFRKSLSRNNMGRLMGIIKQELRTFKGTEDVVMNSNPLRSSLQKVGVDTDKDGIPNRLDIDDDNDGVMDPNDID